MQQAIHFRQALLPSGWRDDVRVEVDAAGLVATITEGAPAVAADERHAIGLPGMGNLHSHAFQRGMAGLAEVRGSGGDSFWSWREAMYRFVGRLDPQALHAIAAMAYVEMLESGFTRVGEFHYLHHDLSGRQFDDPAEMSLAALAAADEAGIAITHLPVFYAHGGFGGQPTSDAQRRFVTDFDGFARLFDSARSAASNNPDALVGVAPHSLRAVTKTELAALAGLAGSGPIHIHIAEQVREVADCIAWSGQRPVGWLLDHVDVGPAWCLVHATHMTEGETLDVARSGAVVGLCPITEANLGDGLFPAAEFQAAGGRYGIGSDSNVLIDMSEELRLLEYGQRLSRRARNVLAADEVRSTGQTIFDANLAGGAQALGFTPGIVVGQPADMVSLDTAHPSLASRDGQAIVDSFVFAAGKSAVDTVWRRGKPVVQGGRHIARETVAQRYRDTLAAILV